MESTLHPKVETMDTQESHLFIVHIPDGFARGDIGAKVEYDFGSVRVFGERSIESNKMIRFNEKHQVPSHCDIGNIRGKFDGKTVTIIMPNIISKVPQQNTSPHQDPKKTFIEKGKEMINDKLGDDSNDDEKKSDKKSFHESTKARIKDITLSTTTAVTNYAKRFNEEDRQKLIYTGVTILVVALGVYASYKYRSSRRL